MDKDKAENENKDKDQDHNKDKDREEEQIVHFPPHIKITIKIKQARKSSEDTHFTEYARFEKVWAG